MPKRKFNDYKLENLPSMTDKLLRVLRKNGILNIEALAIADLRLLIAWGIPADTGENVIEEAGVIMDERVPFQMGDELLKELEKDTLTTGCKNLDRLLGGGFNTKTMYVIYGKENVGKTNFLHHLLCRAMQPVEKGGLGCPVIFIDSEKSFSYKRIIEIAPRFALTPEYVINNMGRLDVSSSEQLVLVFKRILLPAMKKIGARVVLVDSIIANPRGEYGGRDNLSKRQHIIGECFAALQTALNSMNAVGIVITQVTAIPLDEEGVRGYGYSGGNVLGHSHKVRLEIKFLEHDNSPNSNGLREFVMEKSLDMPLGSCQLKLTSEGFHDVKGK